MRLSNALFLFRIRLRSRAVQELLAVAGIAIGVGLVFAALIASTSLTGSIRQMNETIVGDATLQLSARGGGSFDQAVAREVRRVDGVKTAAPLIEISANVVGPQRRASVLLIGGDPEFTRLGGTLLSDFVDTDLGGVNGVALPTPLAESLGLSFAQRFRVEVESREVPATVAVRLDDAEIGALVHHPVALAPLQRAQALAGLDGRVTRILVEVEPEAEQGVIAALERIADGRLDVRPADAEVEIFSQAAYPTNQSTALFSVFSALVGFLFAFSAVLLTVPQRRRFVTDIRMAGHDSRAVVQLLLLDALALGAVGSLAGLALGDQLSRQLFDAAPGHLAAAFPVGAQRIVTWEAAAVAVGAGLAAACVAVFVPLRAILAYRPSRRAPPGGPLTHRLDLATAGIAVGLLAAVTILVVTAPGAALVAIALLTIALLLVLPLLIRSVTAGVGVVTRTVHSVVPTLALQELGSSEARARSVAVAATGAVAVFATVAIGGAHADLERGLDASARDIDRNADIWVTFEGKANILATTTLGSTRGARETVRSVPGVERADWYRGSFLDLGDRRAWIIAPPTASRALVPPTQILEGGPETANARLRDGGWIALSRALSDDLGAELGDQLTLDSPVPQRFRVAAVTTNLGWSPGAAVLNADDYARAWGSPAVSALHVDVGPGVPPARVAADIRRAIGASAPMRVETAAQRVERHYSLTREGLSRLSQISAMVLISAVLAMVVAMAGMIWQRRRAFAALKVQGFSEGELWRALLLESTVLLGTAGVAGAAFGLYGQVLLSRALEAITGFPVFYSAGAVVAASVLAIAVSVAIAMLAVPGWLAVRVRPQPGVPR